MSKHNKMILHNKLFFKMYLSYACVLTISATLIGVIFMMVYKESTMQSYYTQLERQAKSISDRLTQYIIDEDYVSSVDYVQKVIELDDKDIWVISNETAENPLNEAMVNINFTGISLQKEYQTLIEKAFYGYEEDTFYDEIHGDLRNVVALPIKGLNGELVGALIYSSPADSQTKLINQSIRLIIQCILAALVISIVMANLFVRNITNPILKMRNTASELAEGDYTARTDVTRKDEIGELATTVDVLADRLLVNEKERENMEQMRLDFFANVSHELRTPITVVRAYTEMLSDKVVTDEEKVNQYYERMLHECKSMERLVGDLLVLSKMQNPDFEIEKEPVNIMQIFEDIIRSASTISEEKHITIELDTNTDCCLIFGDYDRLRQMFMIILDNAIKFSQNNSCIHIKIKKEDTIKISIRDQGIGISKEELPYIFDKFYKSKLRQNANGTGLGLAIARQIALKHNGSIEVESELGVGTEFSFCFQYLTEDQLQNL